MLLLFSSYFGGLHPPFPTLGKMHLPVFNIIYEGAIVKLHIIFQIALVERKFPTFFDGNGKEGWLVKREGRSWREKEFVLLDYLLGQSSQPLSSRK